MRFQYFRVLQAPKKYIKKEGKCVMKIAIYGTGNYALRLIKYLEETKSRTNIMNQQQWTYEIVYFVESIPKKNIFIDKKVICASDINWDDFDFLVIAIAQYEEIITYLKSEIECYEQNIKKVVNSVEFTHNMKGSYLTYPYQCVNVNGGKLKFLYSTKDRGVSDDMIATGCTYSDKLIDLFFSLTRQYYGERKGVFLDIGANIGTTSIYVKKIVNPKLRVIGIECGKENYNLFRINCILNNSEDIVIEEIGFSNYSGIGKYKYSETDPGGSCIHITNEGKNQRDLDDVSLITLDEYIKNKNINSRDIGYIWMDTEGHESEIIEGAMNTLSGSKIPLMQEFNYEDYIKKGLFDSYLNNIKKIYTSFIDARYYLKSNEMIIKNIYELREYCEWMKNSGRKQTDLFFF